MNNLLRIPAALLLSMFLFGCGQSGPLYLPGNPSTVQTPPEQPQSEEDDEEEESDEAAKKRWE